MTRSAFFNHARRFHAFAWGDSSGALCSRGRQQCFRRNLSNTSSSSKPYYVTTPIFYVNAGRPRFVRVRTESKLTSAEPHVGHLYTSILADVLKRWHALRGQKAVLCTGTDEHGMKIQRAAEKAGMETKAFCDDNASHFLRLADAANIDYDHFIRTSEPEHRFAVQHFWLMLKERGYIYQSKHEGWYSVSDETFYPESQIHRTLDPSTGRTFMASIETGKEVEWTSEENYHFRLSAFREQLLEHYKENPEFIVPDTRMREVVNSVTEGLTDLSISRPASRLSWGIPVPDDETQTIYVWLDALINYLTKANYPFQIPGQEHAGGWPADTQVIGKDIVRFHCVYWPAFLMALQIPVTKQFLTHAHWTIGRQKMSKSTGNVVNPFFAIDRFGVDAMRYFLTHNGGIRDDTSYDNDLIVKEYKKGLQGGIGNLVTRLTRSPKWNIRESVGRVSQETSGFSELSKAALVRLGDLPSRVEGAFRKLDPGQALKMVMDSVYDINRYLQDMEPWNVARKIGTEGGDNARKELDEIIFTCAESLRICALLLQPVMPGKMEALLDMLGVDKTCRLCTAENLQVGSNAAFGTSFVPLGKKYDGLLFPPLATEE